MKKVAVIQSNYIPWKGYFDIIHDVDLFVFYDDVQFTKNDWRNRNKYKTQHGTKWISIPVGQDLNRLVCEVKLEDLTWQQQHYKMLTQTYAKAKYIKEFLPFLDEVYLSKKWDNLSELNQFLIREISKRFLKLDHVQFEDSRKYNLSGTKLDRLMGLLKKNGAEMYVTGPAAEDYITPELFHTENIQLVYKKYDDYPEYEQIYPPFDHFVTIFDLLFHCGSDAPKYIWGHRK
jgi:hypothetical protein